MTELMPVHEGRAADLEVRLSGTMFRSTQDFITFYNSGLVNKTNEEVMALAEEIADTFKNVRLQGRDFVFVSRTEVELTEVLEELVVWDHLVKVRDRISSLVDADVVGRDEAIAFVLSNSVQVCSLQDGQPADVLIDRAMKGSDWPLVERLVEKCGGETEESMAVVEVASLLSLSTSFVAEVHRLVLG